MKIKDFYKNGIVTIFAIGFLLAVATSAQAGWWGSEPSKEQKGYVTIKGSDTLLHLASAWAETYMKTHDTDVSVTGGGSGTGIAALLNGTTDISTASRKIKKKELTLASKKGFTFKEVSVAMDGISVVVNPDNPVNVLTMEQLHKIFTGAYNNWSSVNGPDEKILLLTRDSSSGTYAFFQKKVLKKDDYAQDARLMSSNSAIIQSVSVDKWAVGYVGLGYALNAEGKIKIIKVKKSDDSPAIEPSQETVKSDAYPIARKLYFYIKDNAGKAVKSFIDFALSNEGQKTVQKIGFVPIN